LQDSLWRSSWIFKRQYISVTVWTVLEELAHINKTTNAIKDAACQSRENLYDSENTPASKDPDSNPMDEEEYEVFNDEDMYYLDDSNTINSVVDESH